MAEQKEPQQKMVMMLLAFLVPLGIHRLMMGYSNWWVQLLLTIFCGVGAIWCLIDGIQIATGNMKMADGRDLV